MGLSMALPSVSDLPAMTRHGYNVRPLPSHAPASPLALGRSSFNEPFLFAFAFLDLILVEQPGFLPQLVFLPYSLRPWPILHLLNPYQEEEGLND